MRRKLKQSGAWKCVSVNGRAFLTREFSTVPVSGKMKDHYLHLNYKEKGGVFKIRTQDLKPGSNFYVQRKCKVCSRVDPVMFYQARPTCHECTVAKPFVNGRARQAGDQEGRWVSVPNFGGFTKEWIYITADQKSRRRFSSLRRAKEFADMGLIRIPTLQLPPQSHHSIQIRCPFTGKSNQGNLRNGCCCSVCIAQKISRKKIGISPGGSDVVKRMEQAFRIKILKYQGMEKKVTYRKLDCPCVKRQGGAALSSRGPLLCEHDKFQLWFHFEVSMREELGVTYESVKFRGRQLHLDGIDPKRKRIYEFKSMVNATFVNFGGRDPRKSLRRYQSYARTIGYKVFVLVNCSAKELGAVRSKLPGSFRVFYPRERWPRLGLSARFAKKMKDFQDLPYLSMKKALESAELKIVRKYLREKKKLGRHLSDRECRERVLLSMRAFKRMVSGNRDCRLKQLDRALKSLEFK